VPNNDKELVEQAAASIGLAGEWKNGEFRPVEHAGKVFDPLNDDADAFRLVVSNNISVDSAGGEVVIASNQRENGPHIVEAIPSGDEPYSQRKATAARRAVVRVASELAPPRIDSSN
jgi:hypothetical protein